MRIQPWAALPLLVVLSLTVAGDEPKKAPVPRAARDALAKHDKAVKDATEAFRSAVIKAESDLVDALKKAKTEAMDAHNLDQANAIAEEIDAAKVRAASSSPDTTDKPSPRELLARRLSGSKWSWPDRQIGQRAWFRLNEDGTVTAGWHGKIGLWTATDDKTITARVSTGDSWTKFTVDAAGKVGRSGDGKEAYNRID